MGEAKRRKAQGREVADELGRRVLAGEFGAAGAGERYLMVLDKSPRGREMLAALRGAPAFVGLPALFEAEPFRLWEVSALFDFLVLTSGDGAPAQRSFVAAGIERLLQDAVPRARRRLGTAGAPAGVVLGLDEAVRAKVLAAMTGR